MTFSTKILLLIPNLGFGGAQRVFHDHSVELANNYDVTEVVFNADGGDLYPSGNPVVSLKVSGGGGALAKLQNFRRRISGLRQLRERLQPLVVISHLEGADYVNLLSGGPGKTILCVHGSKLHDANIRGPLGWLRKKVLIPRLYNRADRIVTVSRDIMPELIEGFGVKREKLLTINNFFEVAQIEAKSQEPLSAAEAAVYAAAPVLVTSGRLTLQKNQAPLLDIFAAVIRQQPAKLVFVGDGELRDSLLSHARTLGLRVFAAWEEAPLTPEYDVYFLGLQQNPFKYLRPATAFVFPSAWEGFPMALGEAMVCGLPVLSTDCPTGPREMLAPATATPTTAIRRSETGAYGILLPMLNQPATLARDQAEWTAALTALLADAPERARLGQLAARRMQDFTRERIFGQWVELIEQVGHE
ncbi:glycosyltransferase [Hymenobacter sp. UYCo722]|uniref:glycosyltransferase n=1 Tax=Hymenobacter sp. UYCo722 TaxID=3156335 RepID=UPI00339639CA